MSIVQKSRTSRVHGPYKDDDHGPYKDDDHGPYKDDPAGPVTIFLNLYNGVSQSERNTSHPAGRMPGTLEQARPSRPQPARPGASVESRESAPKDGH